MKLATTVHDHSERMVECIDLSDESYDDAIGGSDVVFDSEGVMAD
jgi:hypothetical protein